MVEQPSLDKLAEWRGDDDDDPNAMEEILREVIVIPDDDEDENTDDVLETPGYPKRQSSVEVVSSHAIADDLETRAIDYGTQADSVNRYESPESDIVEIQYLGHGQYAFGAQDRRGDPTRNHKIGVLRKRAWEQALDRYRKEPGKVYPREDHLQDREVPKPGRPELRLVSQVHSQYGTEENISPQLQSPVQTRRSNHMVERPILLPSRHSEPQMLPRTAISFAQVSIICAKRTPSPVTIQQLLSQLTG